MSQPNTDETMPDTATKAPWAAPVIETYDVAEFTLGNRSNPGDGLSNRS